MCRLITSACGFKRVGDFVVGVVRRIYIPGRARCGGRGNLNVGACHSVAREAAPTITSVRFDSTGGSVGRLIASARGCVNLFVPCLSLLYVASILPGVHAVVVEVTAS